MFASGGWEGGPVGWVQNVCRCVCRAVGAFRPEQPRPGPASPSSRPAGPAHTAPHPPAPAPPRPLGPPPPHPRTTPPLASPRGV